MAPTEVPGTGRLISRTMIRRPSARFREEGAYVVAVIDLDARLRITGRLKNTDQDLDLGARVAATGQGEGYMFFGQAPA